MPTLPSSNAVIDTPTKQPAKQQTADDINDLFKELDDDKVGDKGDKETKADKKTKDDTDDVRKAADEDSEDLELVEPDEDVEKLDLSKTDDLGGNQTPPT